ncbi:MAG: hypothetical protein AB7N53_18420 [Candidatus Binatia bacterium]
MFDLGRVFERRWWILPLSVFLLGLICLKLQDLESSVRVATADFVSVESSLKTELPPNASSREKFEIALYRLQAATPALSMLAGLVGLVTVAVALLGVRAREIPWWVQIVTVLYALYCGVWTVLTAPLI